MLEELSLTLPRFQVYEQTLPMDHRFQQALVDVYSEFTCFYARTIHFLRVNPHLVLRKNAWQNFRNDFSQTVMRIKRMSTTVEREAELARMHKDEVQYSEVLELLKSVQMNKTDNAKKTCYNNLPFAANTRFSGREGVLDAIDKALGPQTAPSNQKSIALSGMGGVGKTQIATQYAYLNLEKFDVILWIAASNAIVVGQSFHTIAEGLGLLESDEEKRDAAAAIYKMKSWLATTSSFSLPRRSYIDDLITSDSTCLIIFDNADDLTCLKTAWPGTFRGSVLLTTRDSTVATTMASQNISVNALTDEDGSKLLLKALDLAQATPNDEQHAYAITKAFGGLPLALSQIGGFIKQRRMSLGDFLPLYARHSAKIDARKAPGSDYDYTLSTVWNVSFEKLTEDSARLLNLLSYFDPDSISEDILLQGGQDIGNELSFLSDEME